MVEPAEFEYQEMRVQLEAMEKQGVTSRLLDPVRRAEIEGYIRKVAAERPSQVPVEEIGRILPGSKWRLAFSTDSAVLGDLPPGAEVRLEFFDDNKVDYILNFAEKTLGLNRLVAKSNYVVGQRESNAGMVTFVIDEIVTDIFGFKNIGVGFFGLLKGKANIISTTFLDG
eukprot:CAMPEP_0116552482 /NCGR_PEP_ID=MMETSP0397-20121206/6516_1 /TAXON_ID=216820 /ORGANISM="Cyclophora tenuis, Strain ECT3854" /LENGTH=169 /DNA_ID=CAMNT_0004077447 /DNA_START=49 /DNA_END=555 /DNA_ORIENTATION=+